MSFTGILDQLAGLAGFVMLGISILYAITVMIVALKKTHPENKSIKVLRITVLISFILFILDYLFGRYGNESAAMTSFVNKMLIMAVYGILVIAAAGISLIISKLFLLPSDSRTPDTKVIWRCFLHGFITAAAAFALRFLMTGYI